MAFAWQNWHFVRCVQLFNKEKVHRYLNKYKLFAGWEVRMVKSCDRGLENAGRGRIFKAEVTAFHHTDRPLAGN